MNRKEDTVFCYYAHNSVWTCELGYGADTMFHRTYFLFVIFCVFFAILYLYPSEFTYNRQPALMIPGFSGLPVLYLYFFR